MSSLHEVIFAKNQFSSMSISTHPEFNLPAPGVTDPQYPSYLDATNIVNAIVAGTDSDPTNGALYYANLAESTSGWFFRNIVEDTANHPLPATIGHRVFLPVNRGSTHDESQRTLRKCEAIALCFVVGRS